ncbi:MAG: hypothetical protein OXN25_07035 [Candidatus Poribacteria bacterium]|nr:hypothetical protein [Candidatus Poribacteria bacterium]
MIRVKYKREDNYPHNRELILFDRDAFQSLGDKVLCKVNEKYNILCPQVFVIECLAPNKASWKEKEWLLRKLELIENPIVLTGNTHVSPVIEIPYDVEYPTILSSEEIARGCIKRAPITMERVTPEKLIAHYKPRLNAFKNRVKTLTEACELERGSLTTKQLISRYQRRFQRTFGTNPSEKEVRNTIRSNKLIFGTQKPNHVAKLAQQTVENTPVNLPLDRLKTFFHFTDRDITVLLNRIRDRKMLTPENYPDLAYLIYIYYLMLYIIYARQHETQHIDKSYVRDFRYLHYLNFCDMFIANEKSTPYIVNSIPFNDIRATPIITVKELKNSLN